MFWLLHLLLQGEDGEFSLKFQLPAHRESSQRPPAGKQRPRANFTVTAPPHLLKTKCDSREIQNKRRRRLGGGAIGSHWRNGRGRRRRAARRFGMRYCLDNTCHLLSKLIFLERAAFLYHEPWSIGTFWKAGTGEVSTFSWCM